jgi:hypothetical protein
MAEDWDIDPEKEDHLRSSVVGSILDPFTIFAQYKVTIQFREKLMGGVPYNPKLIEGWLRTKMEGKDAETMEMVRSTLNELGWSVGPDTPMEEIQEAYKKLALTKVTNGFKQELAGRRRGLYIETRQLKAMLKEATNILYAGERWGVTKKGPRNFLAERVFVRATDSSDFLFLGRQQPDGIEMVIGHVSGPQGPRSTLTYHQYCFSPTVEFVCLSLNDCITEEQWVEMLTLCEEGGLGALRSQGHGKFNVLGIERIEQKKVTTGAAKKLIRTVQSFS